MTKKELEVKMKEWIDCYQRASLDNEPSVCVDSANCLLNI